MNARVHTASFSIPASHPCLPGHFPGHPVVPGVVLLDRVLREAEAWLGTGTRIRTLSQVKFLAPLSPEQLCELELSLQALAEDRQSASEDRSTRQLRFTIRRGNDVIVQGSVVTTNGGRD
jgi:3-hydroxyacyl-[acyl-carrier-protein] dehydratase